MLHWLNLKNNSNQGLCLFRQKQILRSSKHKNFQNQNNEAFLANITQFIEQNVRQTKKLKALNLWTKPFIKSFTSSSGSSLQINLKFENIQVKIYFIIYMRVSKSLHFY